MNVQYYIVLDYIKIASICSNIIEEFNIWSIITTLICSSFGYKSSCFILRPKLTLVWFLIEQSILSHMWRSTHNICSFYEPSLNKFRNHFQSLSYKWQHKGNGIHLFYITYLKKNIHLTLELDWATCFRMICPKTYSNHNRSVSIAIFSSNILIIHHHTYFGLGTTYF
jgi:hypothetical protein